MRAGVVLRSFDMLTPSRLSASPPWESAANNGIADRFSASLFNKRMPFYFRGGNGHQSGGFVVAPHAAAAALLCSYPLDANTNLRICERPGVSHSCVPGCVRAPAGDAAQDSRTWCNESQHRAGWQSRTLESGCPWRPVALAAMIEAHEHRQSVETAFQSCTSCCTRCNPDPHCVSYRPCSLYNELVLDSAVWAYSLPMAIEAVFFTAGLHKVEERARDARCRLLAHFNLRLSASTMASTVPLVVINVSADEPFALASHAPCPRFVY